LRQFALDPDLRGSMSPVPAGFWGITAIAVVKRFPGYRQWVFSSTLQIQIEHGKKSRNEIE
jgi:hypothetical protein